MRVACIFFQGPTPTSRVAEQFLRFSPQICLRQDRAIFVEIGKSHRLFRDESFLARTQVLLRRVGVTAQVALGREVTDSLALAMHGGARIESLPLRALKEFADPFDRDVFIQKQISEMVATLSDLGLRTLGDFQKIPVGELIARYGVLGRHCWQRVRLLDAIPWPLWRPEEKIIERKQFPYFEFYGELDPILFELKAQLDRIFLRLRARQKKLTRLRVEIQCEKNSANVDPRKVFDFEFYSPQSESKGTLRIIKERLMRQFARQPIRSPIEEITSEVRACVTASESQKNIFNNDEEKHEQLSSLHNQLIEILGKEQVFQAELVPDRRPERGWQKRFAQPHVGGGAGISIENILPERATYLLKYPVKIEVAAGYIRVKDRRYRILKWGGEVERISGGWYEKPDSQIQNSFDRNYHRVELEGHQRVTVFETPSHQFYLHGYYG